MSFKKGKKKLNNKKKSKQPPKQRTNNVVTAVVVKNTAQDLFENLNYIDDEELSMSEDLVKQHETPTSNNQRSNAVFNDDDDYDDDNVIYEGNYSDNENVDSHEEFINELNKNYEKENKKLKHEKDINDNTSEDGTSDSSESDLNLDEAIDDARSEKRGLLEEESFKCCSEPNTPSGRLSPVASLSNRPFKFEHNVDSLFKSAKTNGNSLIKNANNHHNVNSFVYDVNLYNNQNIMLLNFDKDEFDKQLRLKKKKQQASKNSKAAQDISSSHSSSSSINNNIQRELEPLIIEEESGEDEAVACRQTHAINENNCEGGGEGNPTLLSVNKIYNYETCSSTSSTTSSSSNQSPHLNNTISPSNSTIVKSLSSSSSQLANVQSDNAENNQPVDSNDGFSGSTSSSSSSVSAIVDSIVGKNDDNADENQRTESLEAITDLSKKVSRQFFVLKSIKYIYAVPPTIDLI